MRYIGKDVIHYGCGLELNPETVLTKISHSARKNIKKTEQAGIVIKKSVGTPEELTALRKIWYYPEDPNFPTELSENDFLYLATLKDELVGGMILFPVGTHLFLNNLTANETGKLHQVQGGLLWHAVNEFKTSHYRYIDVGVSYRPDLYRFFKKWATFHYPVIMNPPVIRPQIHFTIFKSFGDVKRAESDEKKVTEFCLGRPYTILPAMEYAENVLKNLALVGHRVTLPTPTLDAVQIVDLTRILPIPYGVLIIGREIPPALLWEQFACYDHFKTEYIKSVLSYGDHVREKLLEARKNVHDSYTQYFRSEDVTIMPPSDDFATFALQCQDVLKIAECYRRFGVEIEEKDGVLHLPCHPGINPQDVEYLYAIYRGFLNLCSEWVPTAVKGKLSVAK